MRKLAEAMSAVDNTLRDGRYRALRTPKRSSGQERSANAAVDVFRSQSVSAQSPAISNSVPDPKNPAAGGMSSIAAAATSASAMTKLASAASRMRAEDVTVALEGFNQSPEM